MKTKFLFIMIVCTICLTSCVKDSEPEFKGTIGLRDGGNYTIVNLRTNDTLSIAHESAHLTIIYNGDTIVNSTSTIKDVMLNAYNGDTIKIQFEPKEQYKDYSFITKYTLPNGQVIENQPEYKYVVGDNLEGSYDISLYAESFGEEDDSGWSRSISASGEFTLMVNRQ